MNMREIELLCELEQYKSFADASFCLPYSPSVITKYVSNVEAELGIKLFIRSNKSRDLVLTPEGAEILRAMRAVNGEYQHLLELVQQLKNHEQNAIRIGSQPRFGNIHEQKIIAAFLLENQNAGINMLKGPANELIEQLLSGKADAAFITLHRDLNLQKYFGKILEKLNIMYIASETDMYMGIAERYLPGKTEAELHDFADFTLAFPFQKTEDEQNVKAASTWLEMAEKSKMKLKAMYLEGYDNTIFQIAAMKPIAVTTTNVTAKHEGIKFVKLKNWTGCTHLYLVYPKNNQIPMVKSLRKSAMQYKHDLEQT